MNRFGIAMCALLLLARPDVARPAGSAATANPVGTQPTPVQFGGAYSGLDPRRQQLINDWVARFSEVTGQKTDPASFYDTKLRLSTKTTFDAVTNALMTTPLTSASGETFGNGLDLIERVDAVKGQIAGAQGDRQFRIYVRLKEDALDLLERSQEFNRGVDNSVYHKGYPINYRQQGGAPSIQLSIAPNGRNADIDVDYRTASFPVSMFNGHMTASNSDVRSGNNYDRHANRWTGFQNWWRSIFGVKVDRAPSDTVKHEAPAVVPGTPRAGNKNIDVMMHDFLTAWLVQGDVIAALSYVSERAYACLALDGDDPSSYDRGMAPFELAIRLKTVHDALLKSKSLDGLTVPVRLPNLALKIVRQPYQKQFVIYSVPDDIAAGFDCESRLTLGASKDADRAYGRYFGATFYIDSPGGKDQPLALLWARENGYWKIVSWDVAQVGEEEGTPAAPALPDVATARVRVAADPSLVYAAREFFESWLIRKNYDAAFRYVSPSSYACYELVRSPDQPVASSLEDAGRLIRANFERAGDATGSQTSLDALIEGVEPSHPMIRPMEHPYSRTFALTSPPNGITAAADCAVRARGERFSGDYPADYGNAFGMNFRFRTRSGAAPVLRMLWRKEDDAWRITAYDIESP